MGRAQRIKGHSFERFVARSLRSLDPWAIRNLEYQNGEGQDIDTVLPFIIQCKAFKRWSKTPNAILAECNKSKKEGFPLALVKIDHKEPLAIMTMKDFIFMLERFKKDANKEPGSSGGAS